jgi:hypothetical protein
MEQKSSRKAAERHHVRHQTSPLEAKNQTDRTFSGLPNHHFRDYEKKKMVVFVRHVVVPGKTTSGTEIRQPLPFAMEAFSAT